MTPDPKQFRRFRFRFFLSTIFLLAGVVYVLFPFDIIPDLLGPLGWVDDIVLMSFAFLNSARAYWKLKKTSKRS